MDAYGGAEGQSDKGIYASVQALLYILFYLLRFFIEGNKVGRAVIVTVKPAKDAVIIAFQCLGYL